MSRNVIAVLIVLGLIGGVKGSQWLYNEVIDGNASVDSQDWEERELTNRRAVQQLKLGENLDNITNTMGTADFNEIVLSGENKFNVLFYRTHRREGDGITTKDECTPLVFENQVLVGWGNDFFNSL